MFNRILGKEISNFWAVIMILCALAYLSERDGWFR